MTSNTVSKRKDEPNGNSFDLATNKSQEATSNRLKSNSFAIVSMKVRCEKRVLVPHKYLFSKENQIKINLFLKRLSIGDIDIEIRDKRLLNERYQIF